MKGKKWYLVATGMLLLLCLGLALQQNDQPVQMESEWHAQEAITAETVQESTQPELKVHVAGAVLHPGVYTLQQGQRVEDALQLAGVGAEADIDALNRAALLTDGQKIVVPSIQQEIHDAVEDGLIDLNRADLAQLMELPGIGQVKAQAILDYREQHGSFSSIEELQQVTGIGEAIFLQIKSKIKI